MTNEVKSIFVDVDGTLIDKDGILNQRLADMVEEKAGEGYEIVLWSARGKKHAEEVADRFDLSQFFDAIVSKPQFVIDDLEWDWIKYTKILDIP